MGLFLNQRDERSEFQQRLAAEIQERAKTKAVGESQTDSVTDSKYLEETKSSTALMWVWILIGVVLVAVAIWLIFVLN